MTLHITDHRDGFAAGETNITRYDDADDNALISLDVLVLSAGQSISLTTEQETAWLLMNGKISGSVGGESFNLQRDSLFDESSSCLHVSANTAVEIVCDTDTEFTVYSCDNRLPFPARVLVPPMSPTSRAGKDRYAIAVCGTCEPYSMTRTRIPIPDWFWARSLLFRAAGPATHRTIIRNRRSTIIALPNHRVTATRNWAIPYSKYVTTIRSKFWT